MKKVIHQPFSFANFLSAAANWALAFIGAAGAFDGPDAGWGVPGPALDGLDCFSLAGLAGVLPKRASLAFWQASLSKYCQQRRW